MITQRAPYGRQRAEGAPNAEAATPTYYGLPALKASHYRWLIATYFFVGGLAGAAQVIAAVADLVGGGRFPQVVRLGRYVALLGALLSPALLIKDLHTPQRWYNMLRIFRLTSPMSIGSWALAAFGSLSGLAAAGQLLADVAGLAPVRRLAAPLGLPPARRPVALPGLAWARRLARLFGLPAAAAGSVAACYTGTLLAATSTPLWAAAPRHLPALFAATSMSTAAAALSLLLERAGAPAHERDRLERLALIAGAAQLVLARSTERHWRTRAVAGPLERQPTSALYHLGVVGLGMLAPVLVHAVQVVTGHHSPTLSRLAAIATLLGGYGERAIILFAGNESATRPEDYFRLSQPATPARQPNATERAGTGHGRSP